MKVLAVLVMALALVSAVAAHEGEHHICHEVDSGREYGEHVVHHAQEQHFSGEMNPGVHHRGYSPCVVPTEAG